jgi:hypothetical protein
MTASSLDLRALIAEAVREVVAEMVGAEAARAPDPSPARVTGVTGVTGVTAHTDEAAEPAATLDPRARRQRVRLTDDADLDRFVRQLLALFENPKNRQDLRAGRLRFHLEPTAVPGSAVQRPAQRVESGAVTERQVAAASEAGHRIILGPRAVLTPLGREKARALGVPIEKER